MCVRIPCEIQPVTNVSVIMVVVTMITVILVVVVVIKVLAWAAAVIGIEVAMDT